MTTTTDDRPRRMHDPEYRALYEQREAARPSVEEARAALVQAVISTDWVLDIAAERLANLGTPVADVARAWLDAREAFEIAARPSHDWIDAHPEYR